MEYESTIISEIAEKQQHWKEIQEQIEKTTDLLDKPIEDGIKETVIAFVANHVHTSSSCGGHLEDHLAFPYVHIKAGGEPKYRYDGEEKIVNEILQKFNLQEKNEIFSAGEAESEYCAQTQDLPESQEYQIWKNKNTEEGEKLCALIEEYKTLKGEEMFHVCRAYPGYRLEAHEEKGEETHEEKKKRIAFAQASFREITEFLKQRYFSN